MQKIFTCNLNVNNTNVPYHVVFENEQYIFKPDAEDANAPTFSFKREDEEWIDQETTSPEIRNEALESLERFLLSQN